MHNCADILKTMSRNLNYLQNTPDAKITNAEFIFNQNNVKTVKNFGINQLIELSLGQCCRIF